MCGSAGLKGLASERQTVLSWAMPAANCIMEVLRALSAAYRGHGKLPAPQLQRKGWAADLVRASQAIGAPVPEALLDPKLAGPVPKVLPAAAAIPSNAYGLQTTRFTTPFKCRA